MQRFFLFVLKTDEIMWKNASVMVNMDPKSCPASFVCDIIDWSTKDPKSTGEI